MKRKPFGEKANQQATCGLAKFVFEGVKRRMEVSEISLSLALMQKMRTTFGYSSRIYCSHFLRHSFSFSIPSKTNYRQAPERYRQC